MQNAEAAHQTPTISKTPYLSKLEAIASSAVRAADKVMDVSLGGNSGVVSISTELFLSSP
jgi:hypothetical protein